MKRITLSSALILPLVFATGLSSCKSSSEKSTDQQEVQAKSTTPEKTEKVKKAEKSPTSVPMSKLTPATFNAVPLKGYFVKNTVSAEKESQVVLINSQEEFNQSFGVAKTMDNTVTPIDFTKNKVVAIFTKPTDVQTTIDLGKVIINGEDLTLTYQLKQGEKQSFKSSALLLFSVPNTVKIITPKQ